MSELWGIARFKFHEGQLEEFKRLSAQAMELVRANEPGTLQYDIYFNDDQSECVVLERYRDSGAAIEHASNLGALFEAVLATVTVAHGELLGEPLSRLGLDLRRRVLRPRARIRACRSRARPRARAAAALRRRSVRR